MKYMPTIAGVLLGLLFAMASITYFLKLVPEEKLPEGTPVAMFTGAFGPTGWLTMVKVCELVGAVLVAIPRTRNLGLLVLGPIVVNIIAFHVFIKHGDGLLNPMVDLTIALSLYLLWAGRKSFAKLLN